MGSLGEDCEVGKIGLPEAMEHLTAYGRRRNWSNGSIVSMRSQLRIFGRFLDEEVLEDFREVTRETMQHFQAWLAQVKAPRTGKPYAIRSQCVFLSAVKAAYAALAEGALVVVDPSQVLRLQKIPRYVPPVISQDEVKRVLAKPDLSTVLGYRDRAILELFYATMIRAGELAGLLVSDLSPERPAILVHGKGRRDRVIPVGKIAWGYVTRYRDEMRPLLSPLSDASEQRNNLFLSYRGTPLSHTRLSTMVAEYFTRAGVHLPGGAHLLRYAGATHLIENGADIRQVQEILGHRAIDSTMGYCVTSAYVLKKAHEKSHPREKRVVKPRVGQAKP